MKTLKLTLKKKWFDMILSGEKTEEYREINDYWKSRLAIRKGSKLAKTGVLEYPNIKDLMLYISLGYDFVPRFDFDKVRFFNGGYFSEKLPNFIIELKEIEINTGKPKWGAEKNKDYFVLKLGLILSKSNCG